MTEAQQSDAWPSQMRDGFRKAPMDYWDRQSQNEVVTENEAEEGCLIHQRFCLLKF